MTVKELIRHLKTFDEDHTVIVHTENLWDTGSVIKEVVWNGYCLIVIEEN